VNSSAAPSLEATPGPASLRVNFSWTLLGNVLYAAAQWAMLVVMAKLTNAESVGRFALGLAVTAPVLMFTNLQLRAVQSTDASRRVRFGDYLGVRIATSAVALLVIGGIVTVSGYPRQTAFVVLAVGLAKVVESLSDVLYGLFQQHERMDRIAHSMIARGTLALAALGLAIWFTRSVLIGVLGMALAWALVLVVSDLPGRSIDGERPPDMRGWRVRALDWIQISATGFPLGVVMLLISLNVNIPRYFIEAANGERALGLFAALSSVLVAGNIVVNALGQSASPRLAKLWADGRRQAFHTLVLKLLVVGVALGASGIVAAAAIGRPFLAIVFTPEYAEQSSVFTVLMISAAIGFVGSFLGYALTAVRAFAVQVPLFAVSCLATAIVSWLAIPRFGLFGAAYALVASAIVQTAGTAAALLTATRRVEPAP
jgi:O-antigen/teichoic acid export membrane protein